MGLFRVVNGTAASLSGIFSSLDGKPSALSGMRSSRSGASLSRVGKAAGLHHLPIYTMREGLSLPGKLSSISGMSHFVHFALTSPSCRRGSAPACHPWLYTFDKNPGIPGYIIPAGYLQMPLKRDLPIMGDFEDEPRSCRNLQGDPTIWPPCSGSLFRGISYERNNRGRRHCQGMPPFTVISLISLIKTYTNLDPRQSLCLCGFQNRRVDKIPQVWGQNAAGLGTKVRRFGDKSPQV